MNSKGKIICNKLLYTIVNDVVLFGLLVSGYYLLRIISYDSEISILLLIAFLGAVFCFYFIRALTVVGEPYDSEGDLAFFIILKLIFLFINGLGILVFFAGPVLAISLIGINTILVSATQYYRILLLLFGHYEIWDGYVLYAERHIVHHGSHTRGFNAIYYVVLFEHENGAISSICIDRFTYYRIKAKGHSKAKLACFYFPRGREYYEVFLSKQP